MAVVESLKRTVQGYGPRTAAIVIIGEAPGREEEILGRPFVGAAGKLLSKWLETAGINRAEVRIENTVEYRPPGSGKIENLDGVERAAWAADLMGRLATLPNAAVLVPLGNVALNAVMGWPPQQASIMKWRGSRLEVALGGRKVTVMPTIHPAAVLRQPSMSRRVEMDVAAIAQTVGGQRAAAGQRELVLWQSGMDAVDVAPGAGPVVIDIETIPDKGVITCVGFATSAGRAVTVSVHYPDYEQGLVRGHTDVAWAVIKAICQSDRPKVLQNHFYDRYWLRMRKGVEIGGHIWDTRWMHHAMYPSDGGDEYAGRKGQRGEDHGLAYLASIYTAENYWKDEARAADRKTQLAYNGKDCAVTFECFEKLHAELKATGRMDYYRQQYEALYEPCFETMCVGIAIDTDGRKARRKELLAEAAGLRAACDKLTGADGAAAAQAALDAVTAEVDALKGRKGKEVTAIRKELRERQRAARQAVKACEAASIFGAEGGVSPTKLPALLYGQCGLPPVLDRETRKPKTDAVTLRRLVLRHATKSELAVGVANAVLAYRRAVKQAEFLDDKIEDSDHRARTELTFVPETGRLSARRNPLGRGMNLQNVDRNVRACFVADPGCVLLQVDLSTAEDRVVKMLTRDPRMIEMARTRPHEFDQHRWNAASMFGVAEADVTYMQRDIAKRTCHGCLTRDAEVLTPNGWRPIYAVTENDEIAVANLDGMGVHFEQPSKWYKADVDCEVLYLFEDRAFCQTVTGNHRMPYETNGKMKVAEASRLVEYAPGGPRLPVVGRHFSGRAWCSQEMARLVAAIQADGHVTQWDIRFHLRKMRKVERLLGLLAAMNIPHKMTCKAEGPYNRQTWRIAFKCEGALPWLDEKSRAFSWRLLHWPYDTRRAFLAELPLWDGHTRTENGVRKEYLTTSEQAADIVQAVGHLTDCEVLLRRDSRQGGRKDLYRLSFNRRRYAVLPEHKTITYTGTIYCPTVSTGFFVMRERGKVSITGNSNYNMGPQTMSDTWLKQSAGEFVRTKEECEQLQRLYVSRAMPMLPEWHRSVRAEVLQYRCVSNSWGRVLDLTHERLDDATFRRAYAFKAQSEVGHLLNQYGFVPLYKALKGIGTGRINMQLHDALYVSVPPDDVWAVALMMRRLLERPRCYYGNEMTIPCTFSVGLSWKGAREWKQLPPKAEMNEAVREMMAGRVAA